MLLVLFLVLALTLCSGVGWRVVSRLRARTSHLERWVAQHQEVIGRLRGDVHGADLAAQAALDAVFSHECKPSAVAHSKPVAKKAPAKKAAAKKAPVRAR